MPTTLFQLEAHGGLSATQILDELRVVFPVQRRTGTLALVQLPYGLTLLLQAWGQSPPAGIRLRCVSAAALTTPRYSYGNMLAQDLFCRLEQLGLQVRYTEGVLVW
jgi:hypothetical protein